MTISMTWANYALIVSVCLVVYYLIVALLFYRRGFLFLSVKKEIEPTFEPYNSSLNAYPPDRKINFNLFGEETEDEELQFKSEENELAPDAQDFADELMAYTSSCDEVDKDELMINLRKIILKYPSLIHSDSRYELSQLIAMYSENNCSVHFSADEISALWSE